VKEEIAKLKRDLDDSMSVRRDLELKVRRRDQKLTEADRQIKTLELVESSLRAQVQGLKDTVRRQIEASET